MHKQAMVIDVCTYNGEKELWDIHYNVLKDHVDEFVVVEFDKTFSGQHKPPSFPISEYPEVRYHHTGEELYTKYQELAESSPNTAGAEHWKREFMQKESIKDTLGHLKDDDVVFIGDVDEIWNPEEPILKSQLAGSLKLRLLVYTYYLNLRSSEQFCGTIRTTYGYMKGKCLNHLRSFYGKTFPITDTPFPETYDSSAVYTEPAGWHFTSMGGAENLKKKLTDSYTQESYATPTVLENVAYNIDNNRDFLGRDFTYQIDESQWPQYLKDNKEKYAHLCR